jgi:hypothetical protein
MSTTSASSASTSEAATVDPQVVHWKNAWKRKMERPMLRAVRVLEANAVAGLNGDSTAVFRLTEAFNKLSNCRNALEFPPLSDTPSVLARARSLTLAACRSFSIGVGGVIKGFNNGSTSTALAGVANVKAGVSKLRQAARVVAAAPTTTSH